MLEYSLDDAEALLTKNLTAAEKTLDSVDSDLGFLRDQTTTLEVSILYYCVNDVFSQYFSPPKVRAGDIAIMSIRPSDQLQYAVSLMMDYIHPFHM